MKRLKGFTLIEVLACLAIIAVLSGIIYAGTSASIRNAKGAECVARLRSFGIATDLYSVDNNDVLPHYLWNALGRQKAMAKEHIAVLIPHGLGREDPFCPLDPMAHMDVTPEPASVSRRDSTYDMGFFVTHYFHAQSGGLTIRNLSKTQIDAPAETDYLSDVGWFSEPETVWWTGHGRSFNTLYVDGHVKGRAALK